MLINGDIIIIPFISRVPQSTWSDCYLHSYITFSRPIDDQNGRRMWNTSYKYKNMCTVQLKFSPKKPEENIAAGHKATQKYILYIYIC
jgi:hypothetical protein